MSTYIDLWNHKSKKTYVEVIINCVLYSHIDSWDKESYSEKRKGEGEGRQGEGGKKKLQRSQPQSCSSRAASGESQDPWEGGTCLHGLPKWAEAAMGSHKVRPKLADFATTRGPT